MPRLSESRPSRHPVRVLLMTAAIIGSGVTTTPAQDKTSIAAQVLLVDLASERGGPARINLSAKLRMLSQRITAMACIHGSNANDELSAEKLTAAMEEFEKIVIGLAMGDESLGIPGQEDSAKALKGLKLIAAEAQPMMAAAKSMLASGGDSPADLATIYAQEPKVLKIAQKLAAEIGAIYANPNSLTTASAMAIDIAGRQRMLLQKMTKEACQISTGAATPETAVMLEKTVSTFDLTLTALIDGMPEAGVQPAPTAEIRAKLEAIRAEWQTVRIPMDAVLAGTSLDASGMNALLTGTDELLKGLNSVVSDYAASATF
jgi:hypothetical protein